MPQQTLKFFSWDQAAETWCATFIMPEKQIRLQNLGHNAWTPGKVEWLVIQDWFILMKVSRSTLPGDRQNHLSVTKQPAVLKALTVQRSTWTPNSPWSPRFWVYLHQSLIQCTQQSCGSGSADKCCLQQGVAAMVKKRFRELKALWSLEGILPPGGNAAKRFYLLGVTQMRS